MSSGNDIAHVIIKIQKDGCVANKNTIADSVISVHFNAQHLKG